MLDVLIQIILYAMGMTLIVLAWAECFTAQKAPKEEYSENTCVACGKNEQEPNSMLCKECERIAYDNSRNENPS